MPDCASSTDERIYFGKDYCIGSIKRHRFHCFDNQSKCLPLHSLSNGQCDCLKKYDKKWYGIGRTLKTDIQCEKSNKIDCSQLREYIQQSLMMNPINNSIVIDFEQQSSSDLIPFRSYCNSF